MKKTILNSLKIMLLVSAFGTVVFGGALPDDGGDTKDPNQGPCGGGSHICLRPDGVLNACVSC